MKNKRLTYVLIPLVLLIWGLIFYRIFMGSDKDGPVQTIRDIRKVAKKDSLTDIFEIKANYRDPFLSGSDKTLVSNTGDVVPDRVGFTSVKPPVPEIIIPDLRYFGLIMNPKSKQKLGLFRLNNKNFILKEGTVQEDFKIVRLFNDSVKVQYKTKRKTFKKNISQT
jgi:hypothetical protein